MTATLILGTLFAAQAITVSVPGPDIRLDQHKDVAFEDLSSGRTQQAISTLEARRAEEPNDPAVLINLGTAYSRMGQRDRAAAAFQAAVESHTFYQLELADGSWTDSRKAARRALQSLGPSTTLAMR